MIEQDSVESVILQARSKVLERASIAEQSGDPMSRRDCQRRLTFLDRLLREVGGRSADRMPDRSVFISYSLSSGTTYFEVLKSFLEAAGFDVITGFQKADGDKGFLLPRVMLQLKRSTIYVGLLTKEMPVKGPQGQEHWSPSVWTMEEKGMALVLGKPFILLVQDGIHDDYWVKTAGERVHFKFTRRNSKAVIREVVDAVKDRYRELEGEFYEQGELPPLGGSILDQQER